MTAAPYILISGSPGGTTHYENAVRNAGGVPLAGYCPPPDPRCTGLLLCGGGDLDPTLFGWADQGSDPPDRARDQAELTLVHAFLAEGRPILGVCRGMQLLNAALGGDLIQDLPPTVLPFHGRADGDLIHPLRCAPGSLLHQLYGPRLQVNSAHHQAVGRMGVGLVPCAWSESGLVEAFTHQKLPILGVQFHPERMTGTQLRPDAADGAAIYRWFIQQCSSQQKMPEII